MRRGKKAVGATRIVIGTTLAIGASGSYVWYTRSGLLLTLIRCGTKVFRDCKVQYSGYVYEINSSSTLYISSSVTLKETLDFLGKTSK